MARGRRSEFRKFLLTTMVIISMCLFGLAFNVVPASLVPPEQETETYLTLGGIFCACWVLYIMSPDIEYSLRRKPVYKHTSKRKLEPMLKYMPTPEPKSVAETEHCGLEEVAEAMEAMEKKEEPTREEA